MEILYLLIPLSFLLVGVVIWVALWAVKSGQFDDLTSPAHRILEDDDDSPIASRKKGSDRD